MEEFTSGVGKELLSLAKELFPICRSITGNGVRQTLKILKAKMPELTVHEVPSGSKAFDWTVPEEWNVDEAYIEDEKGDRVIDFQENNLHLMGYSEPVDAVMGLDELKEHLYTLPEQPDAIPYITSYYRRRWGFCLSHQRFDSLKDGKFHVVIKSRLEPGSLTYGELVLPGKEEREVLISTYVCHPSMANNELSGPMVATAAAQYLQRKPDRRYTYRIAFIPETIGSLVYLSRHLAHLKERVVAGYVLTCIGDERAYSFMPSRRFDSLSDRVARHVLGHMAPSYQEYSFLERGSDERQYCSPGANLPIASLMRSKYGTYPEYHTSLDNFDLVTAEGLQGGYEAVANCLDVLERNFHYRSTCVGEPQLGKRGLYPTLSRRGSVDQEVRRMMNFLAYADGERDLVGLAEAINAPAYELFELIDKLMDNGIVEIVEQPRIISS